MAQMAYLFCAYFTTVKKESIGFVSNSRAGKLFWMESAGKLKRKSLSLKETWLVAPRVDPAWGGDSNARKAHSADGHAAHSPGRQLAQRGQWGAEKRVPEQTDICFHLQPVLVCNGCGFFVSCFLITVWFANKSCVYLSVWHDVFIVAHILRWFSQPTWLKPYPQTAPSVCVVRALRFGLSGLQACRTPLWTGAAIRWTPLGLHTGLVLSVRVHTFRSVSTSPPHSP